MDGSAAPGLSRYAALLVDVKNICHYKSDDGTIFGYFGVEGIDWPKLFERMLDTLDADDYLFSASAYHSSAIIRTRKRQQLAWKLRRAFGDYRQWVPATVIGEHDVDAWLVSELWDKVVQMMDEQAACGHAPPHEVTILLASGDHIFGEVVDQIRRRFGPERLSLRLHTFSWKNSLSGSLSALSQRIITLDDLGIELVKPRIFQP